MSGIPNRDLLPIDESEEFKDPFSELRLFLASKIKQEVEKPGAPKKWSHKIQSEIIKRILPEFSSKFPTYRLGATALKKVWERVNYYYGKISKEAITNEGKLDLEYMIRENLRDLPSSTLPPYTISHQLALKISEAIATLDGHRPNVDSLSRKIWSMHKHLLPSGLEVKSPCDIYDFTDRLILKSLLETSAAGPHYYTPAQLTEKIKDRFRSYLDIASLAEEHSISTVVATLLANKSTFDIPYQDDIADFITRQIEHIPLDPELSLDANCLDIVQRILSLYPIASALPMTLSEEEICEATEYIHSLLSSEPFEMAPPIDGALFLFVQAELHLLRNTELFDDVEKLQEHILESYFQALTLPQLEHQEPLEVLTWVLIDYHIGILSKIPTPLLSIIEDELLQIELDEHTLRFAPLAKKTADFFKRVAKCPLGSDETMERIEIWSTQNELAISHLHCDCSSFLYTRILTEWKKRNLREYSVDHSDFVQSITSTVAEEKRVWILYRHIWYTHFAHEDESGYMRFLKWHAAKYSHLDRNQLTKKLESISREALPLAPV